jgi:hypothetical protein
MASKSKRNRQRRKNKEALLAAPDVAITVAVAAPDKQKKMGGGIMSPPEREMYAEGTLISDEDIFKKFVEDRDAGIAAVKKDIDLTVREQNEKIKQIENQFKLTTENINSDVKMRVFQQQDKETLRAQKAKGGKLPDLTGDGKITQADVLKGRGVFQEGGMPVDTYPNIPPEEMAAVEASQLPDTQMEEDYVDFVMNEALDQEEQTYLMNALEGDPQLSMIFDKVVDTASEFTGSGEVAGPGTGVSDSIPARLSDGEFVMTRKATDQIGADRLQTMMDEAERAYDGGLMRKDEDTDIEDNMNKVMMSSNQMPSLNIRQR